MKIDHSLSLAPEMEKEVHRVAKEEHRTVSELLREAFRQYLSNRELKLIQSEGRKIAKKIKLKPEEVDQIISDGRR